MLPLGKYALELLRRTNDEVTVSFDKIRVAVDEVWHSDYFIGVADNCVLIACDGVCLSDYDICVSKNCVICSWDIVAAAHELIIISFDLIEISLQNDVSLSFCFIFVSDYDLVSAFELILWSFYQLLISEHIIKISLGYDHISLKFVVVAEIDVAAA